MSEKLNTSAAAMAKRGGVSPTAFHSKGWATMTPAWKIVTAEEWKLKLDREIRERSLLRDSLVVGIAALKQEQDRIVAIMCKLIDCDRETFDLFVNAYDMKASDFETWQMEDDRHGYYERAALVGSAWAFYDAGEWES